MSKQHLQPHRTGAVLPRETLEHVVSAPKSVIPFPDREP